LFRPRFFFYVFSDSPKNTPRILFACYPFDHPPTSPPSFPVLLPHRSFWLRVPLARRVFPAQLSDLKVSCAFIFWEGEFFFNAAFLSFALSSSHVLCRSCSAVFFSSYPATPYCGIGLVPTGLSRPSSRRLAVFTSFLCELPLSFLSPYPTHRRRLVVEVFRICFFHCMVPWSPPRRAPRSLGDAWESFLDHPPLG